MNSKKAALIVVDVQNDFADPAGTLYVKGAQDIIPVINRAIVSARASGAPVFYSQDWHPERTPHFALYGGIWPVHCVADTFGAELAPALERGLGQVVRKGTGGEDGYSAFSMRDAAGKTHSTGLDVLLRTYGVTRVLVCGLATDYCVRATALDAAAAGYETVLLTDAIAAVDLAPGDGKRAIAEMKAAGVKLAKSTAQ